MEKEKKIFKKRDFLGRNNCWRHELRICQIFYFSNSYICATRWCEPWTLYSCTFSLGISSSITVGTGSNLYVTDFTNPTPNLQAVTNVGSTTTNSITAANFITTSDRRLKSDIKQIENPFEILDSIKSYEYVKDGKKDAGFIAQEVQETIPYAVFENEEGMLTMSDRPLLAYLYAAVMELKEENKQLKKELKNIKP